MSSGGAGAQHLPAARRARLRCAIKQDMSSTRPAGRPRRRLLPGRGRGLLPRHGRRLPLTPDEIKGRNNWIVWTGGNDRFWDELTEQSVGALRSAEDRLSILSEPKSQYGRDNRWKYLGLVNEPCFDKADRARTRPLRPVARQAARRLPARSVRERDRNIRASRSARAARPCPVGLLLRLCRRGIVGPAAVPQSRLRRGGGEALGPGALLHRPELLQRSEDLVRPYRVGMSCGFCHVGPNPVTRRPIRRIRSGRT